MRNFTRRKVLIKYTYADRKYILFFLPEYVKFENFVCSLLRVKKINVNEHDGSLRCKEGVRLTDIAFLLPKMATDFFFEFGIFWQEQ